MFVILEDKTIGLTRGDVAQIDVSVNLADGSRYVFTEGEVVRFRVTERKACGNVVLDKSVTVEEAAEVVTIELTSEDTRLGGVISKVVEYWYEIELNPETAPQTIVGYDEDGPKILRLYPEGVAMNE